MQRHTLAFGESLQIDLTFLDQKTVKKNDVLSAVRRCTFIHFPCSVIQHTVLFKVHGMFMDVHTLSSTPHLL